MYKGTISGTGVKETRENEITADNVATERYFESSHEHGVLAGEHKFDVTVTATNRVRIDTGIVYAYGYLGELTEPVDLTFQLPSMAQYWIIYGELDKSVVPNTFMIKRKNNQSNPRIGQYTLRQDVLSEIKTGIFQEPLHILRVTANGIEVVDTELASEWRLQTIDKIKRVVYSDTTQRVTDTIVNGAIVTGAIQEGNHPATTAYVTEQIRKEINK